MDLEKRISELEIDVQVADARADAALQIAFKLFELVKDKKWVRGEIDYFVPHLFAEITENDDPAYELALLDLWQAGLAPTNLSPGETYMQDTRARVRLRGKIAERIQDAGRKAE